MVHSRKAYVCVMQLHGDVSREELEKAIGEFSGDIYQRPPVRSHVRRALRIRHVYRLELLEIEGRYVLLYIESDPGTYMRKLCWDMGLRLGVGAHMRELRRVAAGPFDENHGLVMLQELSEATYLWRTEGKEDLLRKAVLPGEYAACGLPKVVLRDSAVESVTNGAQLAVPGIAMYSSDLVRGSMVAMFTLKGELVGIGQALMAADELSKADKGLAVRPVRIVMERGVYPRMWRRRGQ